MTTRRNEEWTDQDFDTLKHMMSAGDDVRAIARVLKRSQIDVAAKAFVSRQYGSYARPARDRVR